MMADAMPLGDGAGGTTVRGESGAVGTEHAAANTTSGARMATGSRVRTRCERAIPAPDRVHRMPMTNRSLALLVAILSTAVSLGADVLDSADAGFTVKHAVTISASRDRVYATLTGQISRWWDSAHTFSGDAANLSIDSLPGGCFCERLRTPGGVQHMRVVYAEQGRLLRMTGGLGPLQDLAASGTLTLTLQETFGTTTVTMTYTVGGYRPGGLAGLAKPVDVVLTSQMDRLKRYIERGTPAP